MDTPPRPYMNPYEESAVLLKYLLNLEKSAQMHSILCLNIATSCAETYDRRSRAGAKVDLEMLQLNRLRDARRAEQESDEEAEKKVCTDDIVSALIAYKEVLNSMKTALGTCRKEFETMAKTMDETSAAYAKTFDMIESMWGFKSCVDEAKVRICDLFIPLFPHNVFPFYMLT